MNPFNALLRQRLYDLDDLLSIIHLGRRIEELAPNYTGPNEVGPIVRYCYRFLREHVCATSAQRFLDFHSDCIYEDRK
jgi:hypothetical protein